MFFRAVRQNNSPHVQVTTEKSLNGIFQAGLFGTLLCGLSLGSTPIQAQSRQGLCDIEKMETATGDEIATLLAGGSGPFERCYDGYTPLHVAVSANNLAAIQIIAEAGADLDAPNEFRSSPLHVAILASNPRAVSLLLDLGANIHSMGPDGQSPLEFARQWGESEIERVLQDRGARF